MKDKLNVLKEVNAPLTQEETGYVAVSPQTGVKQCANCRFFLATHLDTFSGNLMGPACVLVSGYPEPILATGYCDEHELRTPYKPEPMEVEIVDGDADEPVEVVDVEVTEQKAFKVFIAPKDIPIVEKVAKKVTGGLQPGTTIVKKDGARYMLIVSSNGFKDRHDEHVATKALKEYVDGFAAGAVKKNKHMYWHAIEVGDIVAATMINGFLVEIAKEAGEAGKKFYDYVEAHPGDWGASQGFWVRAKDIRTEGGTQTYARIDKDETSTLPRNAAANLFTLSAIGEDAMAQTRFEKLTDEIFGEGTAAALEKGTGELKKHLLSNGVALKQKDAKKKDAATVAEAADAVAEVEETPPTTAGDRDKLLLQLVDGMEALLTGVRDAMSATEVAEEKADEVEEEIKSLRKELTENLAEIREKMKMAPRIASQASETELTDDAAEAAKKALAPKKGATFGGIEYDEE